MRLYSLLFFAFLAGCATGPRQHLVESDTDQALTEAQRYFVEIALRSEFDDVTPQVRDSHYDKHDWIDGGKSGVQLAELYRITDKQRLAQYQVVRRWEQPVLMYIDGRKDPELVDEVYKVVGEVRQLAPRLKIRWAAKKEQANFLIYFGPYKEFSELYAPRSRMRLKRNWGFFLVNWRRAVDGITQARLYVDTHRARNSDERKHLLREELTQALGLTADSKRYPDSIFYQHWSSTTQYSPLDKELIKTLYDASVRSGMDEAALRELWGENI